MSDASDNPITPPPRLPATPSPRKRRKRAWMLFFLVLAVLAAGGITWEVWYNVQQQLTPEKLEAARELWRENGPRDYTLEYAVKSESGPPELGGVAPERFIVEVRDGKVTSVHQPEGLPLPERNWQFESMDSLFDFIARQLEADRQPDQPRAFTVAQFDRRNGHVMHYVHSIMRTRERLEITTTLKRTANSESGQ